MDEQSSTTDVFREFDYSREDISKKASTKSPTFMLGVDAESSEKCDRLRITTRTLSEAFGGLQGVYLSHAPCVIGNNSFVLTLGHDENSGCSGIRRLKSVAMQPLGLFR